jgi:hypothetical protein
MSNSVSVKTYLVVKSDRRISKIITSTMETPIAATNPLVPIGVKIPAYRKKMINAAMNTERPP